MDELTILAQAMKLEEQGREFYLQAAQRSEDPETAAMFRTLASDEVHHYNYLQRQYNALSEGEGWVPIPELEGVEAIDVEAPIFPSGLAALEELPEDSTDEDALLFGLGVELKSFELYSQSAEEAASDAARRLFRWLAAAERQHFDTLMQRYESRFGYPR